MPALPSSSWELTTRAPWHDLFAGGFGCVKIGPRFLGKQTCWNLPGLRLLVVAPVPRLWIWFHWKEELEPQIWGMAMGKVQSRKSRRLGFFDGSFLKDYGEAFEEGDIIGTETQKFTKFHQVPETWEVSFKLPGNISQTYELCCWVITATLEASVTPVWMINLAAYVLHIFHLGLDTLPRPFPILDFIKRLRAFFGVSCWAFQRLHVGPREADGVLQQEWPWLGCSLQVSWLKKSTKFFMTAASVDFKMRNAAFLLFDRWMPPPFAKGTPPCFFLWVDRLSPDMQGIGLKPHICGKVGKILREKTGKITVSIWGKTIRLSF